MKIQRLRVPSRLLDTSLPLIRYGSGGDPWLYLPTSGGDVEEFARYDLPRVVAPWVQRGEIQFITIDGYGPRTLFREDLAPQERIAGYQRFEQAVREELVPWLQAACGRDRLDLLGASYGAFVAVNLWLKQPEAWRHVASLGGVFDMNHRFDDFHDDNVYFHTPVEFLPRLEDETALEAIRRPPSLRLFAAEDDSWVEDTHRLAAILRDKNVPFELDLWGSPHAHHESTWAMQIEKLLGELYPSL